MYATFDMKCLVMSRNKFISLLIHVPTLQDDEYAFKKYQT